jgi:hypothetical protein
MSILPFKLTAARFAIGLLACATLTHFIVGGAQQAPSATERAMAEQAIARLEPSLQAIARAKYNDEIARRAAEANAKPLPTPVADSQATPADLAYNRAQWEPILRKGHAAQAAFDSFVDVQLATRCPKDHGISRSGLGWIYELPTLSNNWDRASNSADLDVQVLGPSYSPTDGRYDFDFSKVRLTFDRAKVESVIAEQCADLKRQSEAFYKGIDPLIAAKDFNAADRFEQKARLWVDPLNRKLDAVIKEQNPAPSLAITLALMNGKRIK